MVKVLYAPMRERYYKEKKQEECPFCNYKKHKDLLIFEGNTAFIIANKYPYSYGHLLVVPKRHLNSIEELNKDEDKEIMLLIKRSVKFLKKAFNPEGFNIGLNQGQYSGGSLDHLHIHVVPRYKGDTGFLQTISNTTLYSTKIEEMVKKLKKANNLK